MRPDIKNKVSYQRGVAIVTAIFLIIILSAIAAFSVSLFRIQQDSSTIDMMGLRALQAANAGLEWGYWQALNPGGASCNPSTSIAMPAATSLVLFTVTVSCNSTLHSEAGSPITIYQIQATACNQPQAGSCPNAAPGQDYVERQAVGIVER